MIYLIFHIPLRYPNNVLLISIQNQFGCQDPTFTMGDMLATLPRVGQPMSASSLPSPDVAAGAQISGGFSRGNQDDPRCNGTLRKQVSPRSNILGSAHTSIQGKAWRKAAFLLLLTNGKSFRSIGRRYPYGLFKDCNLSGSSKNNHTITMTYSKPTFCENIWKVYPNSSILLVILEYKKTKKTI